MEKIIGFIGLGVMGEQMASHIRNAGHELHIYTRTKSKAENLIKHRAIWEDDIPSLAKKCDIIFTIVGFPQDVKNIYFGENGLLENARQGTILVDMTTSSPSLASEITKIAAEKGIEALDAPVSGGDTGAKNGTLTFFVGGKQETFNAVLPYLKTMGKKIALLGNSGKGQYAKLANQIAIAGTMTGMCEAMAFAKECGLNVETVIELLCGGAADTWSLRHYAPRILKEDYDPGFFVKHYIKDMKLAEEAGEKMDLDMPALTLTRELYEELEEEGLEELGTQALYTIYDPQEFDF